MKGINLTIKKLAALPLLGAALLFTSMTQVSAQTAAASATTTSTLTVHFTGVRNAKGTINIALFRDAKGFLQDPASAVAVQKVSIDAKTLTATAVFTDLPQGVYAAAAMHDEDGTGKMKYDSQGIPLAGFGISNNPETSQGPPTAEQAKFSVDKQQVSIEVRLVYF